MTAHTDTAVLHIHATSDPHALIRVLNEVHRRGAAVERLEMSTVDNRTIIDTALRVPPGRAESLHRQLSRLPCVITIDLDLRPRDCRRAPTTTTTTGRADEPTAPHGGPS